MFTIHVGLHNYSAIQCTIYKTNIWLSCLTFARLQVLTNRKSLINCSYEVKLQLIYAKHEERNGLVCLCACVQVMSVLYCCSTESDYHGCCGKCWRLCRLFHISIAHILQTGRRQEKPINGN